MTCVMTFGMYFENFINKVPGYDRSTDDFCIDDLMPLLGAYGQGIGHEIIDQTRISLGEAVGGCEGSLIHNVG